MWIADKRLEKTEISSLTIIQIVMEVPLELYEKALGGHHTAVAEYLAYQHQHTYAYDSRVKKWYRRNGDKWTEDTTLSMRNSMISSLEALICDIDATLDKPNSLIEVSLRKNRRALTDLVVKLKTRPYWDSVVTQLKCHLRREVISGNELLREKEIKKMYREPRRKEFTEK